MTSIDDVFMDIDDFFFAYCIILRRSADEFWNARPSQVLFSIETYREMIDAQNRQNPRSGGIETITSMREIAGWGDKA